MTENNTTDEQSRVAADCPNERIVSCLKAFIGEYYDTWSYGGYDERAVTIVANTESEALGFVLEKYPDTLAAKWCMTEIDITNPGVEPISSSHS